MTIAILCSGQGNQHRDMFALTDEVPETAYLFTLATKALGGRDPRRLVQDGDATIHDNLVGQILCCTQALAAFEGLKTHLGGRIALAGYSVGELASWGCAGLILPQTILDLAVKRATAMDRASGPDDGLAFVRGLNRRQIDVLCERHGLDVAIVNPGDRVVIGGGRKALQALCDEALALGATRAGSLNVAAASHTSRLAEASIEFERDLSDARVDGRLAPGIRLFSGVDGAPMHDVGVGLEKLAAQLSKTVDWAACLEACVEAGATTMLELGPGNALATMASTTYPAINARALDDFHTWDGVKNWLRRAV